MIIFMMGPSGSGKGTQAQDLSEKFGLHYFVMGKFLRQIAKTNKKVDELINKEGVLVPDELSTSLLFEHLEKENLTDNILFDGFPRTTTQYKYFKDWLNSKNKKLDLAILLNISDEEAVKRLSARRTDKETGEIYNLITNPPPEDISKNRLVQRPDDKEDAIKKRLSWYHERTEPLLEILKNEDVLVEVDGERPIEEIQKNLVALLEKLKNGTA